MLTAEQLIQKVKEIATAKPHVCYDTTDNKSPCSYAKGECSDRSVGCIFGQALIVLGVDSKVLADFEENYESAIPCLLKYLKIEGTLKQLSWCAHFQANQDAHLAWGNCLKQANVYMESLK